MLKDTFIIYFDKRFLHNHNYFLFACALHLVSYAFYFIFLPNFIFIIFDLLNFQEVMGFAVPTLFFYFFMSISKVTCV